MNYFRGFVEEDFRKVVLLIDEAVEIAREVKNKTKKLKDYNEYLLNDGETLKKCAELKSRVNEFASKFPMPGHDNY